MNTLDPETRARLLAEYFTNRVALDQIQSRRTVSPQEAAERKRLRARQSELMQSYRDGLPLTPVSRCPFSQEIYQLAMDSFGLDGPWWDYYAAQRPFAEPPAHCIALTGAMRLDTVLEDAPFLRIPGPGAPFLYPHLLGSGLVKAVLHALPVGRHVAYAIVYFASEWPQGVRMPNLWGLNHYTSFSASGQSGWYQTFDRPTDWDFNLGPWIEKGKLLWIAPGDPTMTLHSAVEHCPYLNLPGARNTQRIYGRLLDTSGVSGEEFPQ